MTNEVLANLATVNQKLEVLQFCVFYMMLYPIVKACVRSFFKVKEANDDK